MITPATDLGSIDQEALASFLESDHSPPDCMGLSDLDGFLTGIAVGPEMIMPSEWLPTVWGGEEPTFANRGEAEAAVRMILARYDQVLRDIAAGTCAPIFWEGQGGSLIASDWAHGFRQAIKLRQDAWAGLLKPGHDSALLFPILALCGDADGNSLLGLTREQEDTMFEQAPALIPGCVLAIAAYWRAQRRPGMSVPRNGRAAQTGRAAAKPGRNDPCPCGSGKKFKRCCGQGGSSGPLSQ